MWGLCTPDSCLKTDCGPYLLCRELHTLAEEYYIQADGFNTAKMTASSICDPLAFCPLKGQHHEYTFVLFNGRNVHV